MLGRAFIKVHERAAAFVKKPRWADKNPENALYLTQWDRLLSTRWLFVHVVRNPLDTLASLKERNFPLSVPPSLPERIDFYRKYTLAGLAFGTAHPSRYRRVIYERLVGDPEEELRNLMQWLGEVFEPAQLEFNRIPHQTGLEDPKIANASTIHSDSVGRWTDAFTHAEALLIWNGTRDLWAEIDPGKQYFDPAGFDPLHPGQ